MPSSTKPITSSSNASASHGARQSAAPVSLSLLSPFPMSETFCDLAQGKCKPCEGGIPPLTTDEINTLMPQLDKDWSVVDGRLRRDFRFPDHYVTMTFVNAVAWISHQQGHHPDLTVTYNSCRVEYITHAIDGLSESDFICAAKIDTLFQL